ncbi:MAG: MotA/TolQ/ExbB proton channel family protein [Bdellovibrionaceae bacterium]|nr:MotA/TolQ/ExbB proton channel family protein [Pseudobdellovibrionaceae bacterium]
MITQLGAFFQQGGFWMWPIMSIQIISIALIVERACSLFLNRSANARDIVQDLEKDIKNGDMDKAVLKAQKSGHAPIATLAQVGAQSTIDLGGREELQLKMDEVLIEESGRLEIRIGYLSMLANVATLLGLLGTIVGLIQAFTSVGSANAAEKAKLLSEGVSVAMNTTAYGLVVAVPALIAFAVLQTRANKLSDDLNKAGLRMFIWLGFNVEGVPSKRKTTR